MFIWLHLWDLGCWPFTLPLPKIVRAWIPPSFDTCLISLVAPYQWVFQYHRSPDSVLCLPFSASLTSPGGQNQGRRGREWAWWEGVRGRCSLPSPALDPAHVWPQLSRLLEISVPATILSNQFIFCFIHLETVSGVCFWNKGSILIPTWQKRG